LLQGPAVAISRTTGIYALLISGLSRRKKDERSEIGVTRIECSRTRVCLDSSGIDNGCGKIDHCCEALISFVAAHCDAFEFLEFAKEILDQVPPFIHLLIDLERGWARRGC
jgi:hypothetical protein